MVMANDATAALRLMAALIAELSVSDPEIGQKVQGRLNSMAKNEDGADRVDLERAAAALQDALIGKIAKQE